MIVDSEDLKDLFFVPGLDRDCGVLMCVDLIRAGLIS